MGLRRFDRKFGTGFLRELPEAPAVYLFKDANGEVLYAGQSVNVRRRLSGYRNATRRKAHRKMRELVREADSLEVRVQSSQSDALLLENELIRTLRPRYNVEGAYDFLYPAIGTGGDDGQLWLCFTSQAGAYEPLALRWHGTYRPRQRARDAFDAWVGLLGRMGHLEPRSRWPEVPRLRGSRFVAVRRLPPDLCAGLRDFFDGRSDAVLARVFSALLERSAARAEAGDVQEAFRTLQEFYRGDVLRLQDALRRTGRDGCFVPQSERDALFIAARRADEG
ncbi:MAG: GIY-YIG nuclease family protein [Myxococcales bacterium]|nr:GIY-YIG nuclease family protein [Myxococcales bacterium]